MKTLRLAHALLLAGCAGASIAADSPEVPTVEKGFPEFDSLIAVCTRNEPDRAAEFQRKLDPQFACGFVDPKRAAEIRASKPYKEALDLKIAAFPRDATKAMTRQYCNLVLDNVDEFCATNLGIWIHR